MYGLGTAVFDAGAGCVSVLSEITNAVYFTLVWNVTMLKTGRERMDCQHLNASWAVTFTLGESADESENASFSIRGDESTEPGGQCMPPLDTSGENNFALIGTTCLRRYYSVFDLELTSLRSIGHGLGLED